MDDLTVVIPVRNAEGLIDECLASVVAAGPHEVILVDGLSTDRTLEIAARYPVRVLSDEGRGLPAARLIGADAARTRWVVLVDADVVLPEGALDRLFQEFLDGGYTALQAGLASTGGPGYWGAALAHHHRTGRSKDWFGLVATIFARETLLEHGFDQRFVSGEDIELRWRLRALGRKVGVSQRVVVQHRFAGDDFAFAKDQFLMDGAGLGLMVRRSGIRGLRLAVLPAAAAVRGVVLSSLRGQVGWVRYYAAFTWWNYVGMARGVRR
jgi:glycosyltransferase involved in cell wall biosynthesis